MNISVYNGEIYHRPAWRYVVMGILFFVLVLSTLFSTHLSGVQESWMPGWTDVVSALVLGGLLRGYMKYVHTETHRIISLRITEEGLYIGEKLYRWHAVHGFHILKKRTFQEQDALLFLLNKSQEAHTLADNTASAVTGFLLELEKNTPYMEYVKQPFLQRALRWLKV